MATLQITYSCSGKLQLMTYCTDISLRSKKLNSCWSVFFWCLKYLTRVKKFNESVYGLQRQLAVTCRKIIGGSMQCKSSVTSPHGLWFVHSQVKTAHSITRFSKTTRNLCTLIWADGSGLRLEVVWEEMCSLLEARVLTFALADAAAAVAAATRAPPDAAGARTAFAANSRSHSPLTPAPGTAWSTEHTEVRQLHAPVCAPFTGHHDTIRHDRTRQAHESDARWRTRRARSSTRPRRSRRDRASPAARSSFATLAPPLAAPSSAHSPART